MLFQRKAPFWNGRVLMRKIVRESLTGILFTAGVVFLACEAETVMLQFIVSGLSVVCFSLAFLMWKVVKE